MFITGDFRNTRFKSRREERGDGVDGEYQRVDLPDGRDERKERKQREACEVCGDEYLLAVKAVGDDSGGLGEQQEGEDAKRERVADDRRRRFAARELISKERESDGRHAAAEQGDDLRREQETEITIAPERSACGHCGR